MIGDQVQKIGSVIITAADSNAVYWLPSQEAAFGTSIDEVVIVEVTCGVQDSRQSTWHRIRGFRMSCRWGTLVNTLL